MVSECCKLEALGLETGLKRWFLSPDLHLQPERFIQLSGWEPKEPTALWAETCASQPKNNIALTEMATVCLFFQQKEGGKKAAFSAGGDREG